MNDQKSIRLAALADLHVSRGASGSVQPILSQAATVADIIVICGDITNLGLPEEAELFVHELPSVKTPIVAVLGNHDYHSGRADELKRIFLTAGLHILDGDAVEIQGIGFAGVKGFAGGFDKRMLAPWGEDIIKRFVHEALDEALKLESAMAKLRSPTKVAVMHYAPIRGTVEGEPEEILPFLGSSRLEEPLNRYGATVAFHGHAHHGARRGATAAGVPVFNVASPLLRQSSPDHPPFLLHDLPIAISSGPAAK